jgi:arylsulfatase A-like enzyme
MTRFSRQLLLVVAAFAALVCQQLRDAAANEPNGQGPTNILVLLSDDHNYRGLGCAGNRDVRTPNIDRLATEGLYFDHCFTPMPQCAPSRAALLTGQDTWTNGVRTGNMPFAQGAVLWPQLLDTAGYDTFYTGKWHNAGMPWDRGFKSGANIYAGGMADHRRVPVTAWKGAKRGKKDVKEATKFSSTLFADAVIKFLQSHTSNRPFCAYVSFTAPHDPWVPPDEYATMYDPAALQVPPNFMPRPPFTVPVDFAALRDQRVLPYPRTEASVRKAMSLYYGMITHLDHEIGRILRSLDEQGLADDTLVIFAGDHGHSLGSHGFVGKQCMYEEGIRLPLIMRIPGVSKRANRCDALVSLIDLFPTICDVAGVRTPPGVEGRSLLDLYQGKPLKWRDRLFASHHSPERHGMSTHCVRTQRYKLIEHRTTGELELFDLAEDPFELANLAERPGLAAVQSKLHQELTAWASTHDPVTSQH